MTITAHAKKIKTNKNNEQTEGSQKAHTSVEPESNVKVHTTT